MFVLAELRDRIRILPEQFHLHVVEAINDELNRRLANKVVLNVGLCISLHSIVSIKDSMLVPGDGAAHTDVTFRALVFRPMIGTIITGKIRSCSREGVHVTLGFFDDILLPPAALQHPSRFDEVEQAWIWEYPLEGGDSHDLFLDVGEPIKFRVLNELFEEPSPLGPPNMDPIQQQQVQMQKAHKTDNRIPYRIIGSINESGLGVLRWWEQQEADDEDGDEEDEDEEGQGDEADEAEAPEEADEAEEPDETEQQEELEEGYEEAAEDELVDDVDDLDDNIDDAE